MRPGYRSAGADAPWQDPRGAHGVEMEGYFWRFTDTANRRVVAALCGVCQAADGTWALVGAAAHPGTATAQRVVASAQAERGRLGVSAGPGVLEADADTLRVALDADNRLDVRIEAPVAWPHRLSGVGLGQLVPGLGQYWHPWLLDGRATGEARIAGETIRLDGAHVYAEKNWGSGFPEHWWWGQAHGFDREDACLAFAGGPVTVGPLRTSATALVVRLGDEVLRLGDPLRSPVRADVGGGLWRLRGRSPGVTVEVEGSGAPADAHVLPVPLAAQRDAADGALEHLGAHVRVTVRRGRRLVWTGESHLAGLEDGGLTTVAAELARREGDGHGVAAR